MDLKPRNRYDWLHYFTVACLAGAGTAELLTGDLAFGVYLLVIAGFSVAFKVLHRRAYLEGWMNGRADMLGTMIASGNKDDLSHEEQKEWFLSQMVEHDIAMMRVMAGERETKKFLDTAVKHLAASDGSHDEL